MNYVVQEAIVVIRDIFRKYPGKCLGRQDSILYKVRGNKWCRATFVDQNVDEFWWFWGARN